MHRRACRLPAGFPLLQVHTSSTPELWNMQKCLVVAAAQSVVCIGGAVLFLVRLQAPSAR